MIGVDTVVQFARDGSVVGEWSLADMLDTRRIGYDAVEHDSKWDHLFGQDTHDWTHANAVFYDEATDGILVSTRHQDAVVRFDRATGEPTWILGPRKNWGPEYRHLLLEPIGPEPFIWNYHQHAVNVTDEGTVLVFDNGNNRASPYDWQLPDELNRSRAVEFRIDPVAMTVEKVWSYGEVREPALFGNGQGLAEWQPNTGNVLILFSSIHERAGGTLCRAIEVTRTDPPRWCGTWASTPTSRCTGSSASRSCTPPEWWSRPSRGRRAPWWSSTRPSTR